MKRKSPVAIIAKRELLSYFSSPIAYIVTGLFLLVSGVLFFSMFFLRQRAELRNFFSSLPVLFSLFAPAITMRLFSDEKKSGSIETLLTLPVTNAQVVLGKFVAASISCVALIVPTFFYVVTAFMFGKPDAGPIIGGYMGAVFLCSAFSAIGVFASCLTKNQIIAFAISFIICISLTLIDSFLVFMPPQVISFFAVISSNAHFASIARGIVDSRDVLYFVSVTVVFVSVTVLWLDSEKK